VRDSYTVVVRVRVFVFETAVLVHVRVFVPETAVLVLVRVFVPETAVRSSRCEPPHLYEHVLETSHENEDEDEHASKWSPPK
jgi:hypothetical protein